VLDMQAPFLLTLYQVPRTSGNGTAGNMPQEQEPESKYVPSFQATLVPANNTPMSESWNGTLGCHIPTHMFQPRSRFSARTVAERN